MEDNINFEYNKERCEDAYNQIIKKIENIVNKEVHNKIYSILKHISKDYNLNYDELVKKYYI